MSHTYEVIQNLASIESGLALSEAALRGFEITHDPKFLPECDEGIVKAERGFAHALKLTTDNPTAQRKLYALEARIRLRWTQLRASLLLAKAESHILRTPTGGIYTSSDIRADVTSLIKDEQRLLAMRLQRSAHESKSTERTALIGAGIALALSLFAWWALSRQTAQLREAEEELRLTIDNSPLGMGLVSPDGRWLRINDALCNILGRDRGSLVRAPAQSVTHPADRDAESCFVAQLLRGEISHYTLDKRCVDSRGKVIWVHLTMSLVRSTSGEPRFLVAQFEDISARRSAEAEARVFFEQSADLLAISRVPGQLNHVNAAWEHTLGWTREELTNRPYIDFIHPDDRDSSNAEATTLDRGPPTLSFRNRYRAKDGNYHWLDWRVHPTQEGSLFCIARDVDEHVRREQELHVFSHALAATRTGSLMTDHALPEHPITYVNPAFERMTGYSAAELIGRSCAVLQGSDREQPEIDLLRQAIREESDRHVVLRNYKKNGELFLNSLTISPVRDPTGRVTHFIGIAEDITEIRHEEEHARLLAELMRLTAEARDVNAALDAALRIVCNSQGWDYGEIWLTASDKQSISLHQASFARDSQRMAKLRELGTARRYGNSETVAGRVWSQARIEWHADLRAWDQRTFCRLDAALNAGLCGCVGIPLFSPGGTEGVLLLLSTPPVPENEQLAHVLTTIGGQLGMLIQRKRAEQMLALSEERLGLASKATSDVIYDWDLQTNKVWWGEAVQRNFGYPAAITPLDWWSSRIHPDEEVQIYEGRIAAIRDDQTYPAYWSGEYRFLCANGRYMHIFDRAFILRAADRSATRVIGSMMDISERVQCEQALREAKVTAEGAAFAKTNFLAHMSHEIRTPLTALLGFAELLLDPKLSGSDRLNYALTIRRNGEHLLSVLNDILDISMVEAGKISIESVAFSPAEVITEVVSLMRSRAIDKGLSFVVEYATPIPATVRSDPTRLRQILLNLVNNAVKFTEHGGIRIRARFELRPADCSSQIEISVSDTGIGMDAVQVQRLFQPFSQADTSMSRRFGGSGLGLAICKPLADAMGGVIAVNTALAEGSTFTIKLPVEFVEGSPMLANPTEELSGFEACEEDPADIRLTGHVLLAEDGYDNQRLICTLLHKQGLDVTVVENGQLALEQAMAAMRDGEPYDVVLMDMQMPVLDGYGASARLRAQGYTKAIIALTAHAMSGERERCVAAGCNDYLAKPINRVDLIAAVAAHIPRTAAAADLPRQGFPARESLSPANDTAAARMSLQPSAADQAPPQLVSEFASDPEIGGLVSDFVASLPFQMRRLKEVAEREDVAQLSRLAHQLKGAAGGYGFPTITEAAARLEQRVKEGGSEITDALTALGELCERTQASTASIASIRPSLPSLLVIDDSPETQALVAARLGNERVAMRSALSARAGLALAFENPPDLVLLDLDLPDMDGLGVCRALKADPRTAEVPVLFLTGTEDAAIMEAAFDLGAVDYVTKPFEASELRARVRSALRTKHYQDLLTNRARLDGLTGLWNRTYFDQRLVEEMSAGIRHNHPVSIAIVDIDHFKLVNDTYGHPFGDQVLQAFGSALLKTLRTSDVGCRYGGEEFVVILRETSSADSMIAAERIRKLVFDLKLRDRKGLVQVTASVGVASVDLDSESDLHKSQAHATALVEAADAALYRAKDAGRNLVMLGVVGERRRAAG